MKLHKNLQGDDLHDPKQHRTSHESGGADEISVEGLSGQLAGEQNAGFENFPNDVTALPGDVISLLRELTFILSSLETKVDLLAQEAGITFPV